jgi:hypothetical protein
LKLSGIIQSYAKLRLQAQDDHLDGQLWLMCSSLRPILERDSLARFLLLKAVPSRGVFLPRLGPQTNLRPFFACGHSRRLSDQAELRDIRHDARECRLDTGDKAEGGSGQAITNCGNAKRSASEAVLVVCISPLMAASATLALKAGV